MKRGVLGNATVALNRFSPLQPLILCGRSEEAVRLDFPGFERKEFNVLASFFKGVWSCGA